MKKNNVVVFDLDGTLLDANNKIIGGDKTIDCLTRLKEMGCVLSICTGRLDHDIIKTNEKYNLNILNHISQNGAVLVNDNHLQATLLNKNEALDINSYLEDKDVRVELNTISNRYWKTDRDPDFPKELYDSHCITNDYKDIILYQPTVLFLVIGKENVLKEIEKDINSNYKNTKAVLTSATSLEIMDSKVSKGYAIKTLYSEDEVYSIGDAPSDFDMYPVSKIGYLVSDIECDYECDRKPSILEALQDIINNIQ